MKALKSIMATLVASLFFFSLPAVSATYIQTIDDFESGSIGSIWSINGSASDVGAYNAISSYYGFFFGPDLYYPPEGSWMMVLNGGEPMTTATTQFTAYTGATLSLSWFFSTLDGLPFTNNDRAGISMNGTNAMLITSSTTGFGIGADNTGWVDFSMPISPGNVELSFWAENVGDYLNDPRLAIDNIRVLYADGMPPELGGGNGGGVIPSVPEPSTYALFGIGLLSLSLIRRYRRSILSDETDWRSTEFSVSRG